MSGFTTEILSSPVVPLCKRALISGSVQTDVIFAAHSDCHVVTISQMETLGTIISAEVIEGPDGRRTYEVNTLMGKRDDQLLNVYARQLIERMSQGGVSSKPLILTIALSKNGRGVDIFNDVLNAILEMLQ